MFQEKKACQFLQRNKQFLLPDTHPYMCVSGGKKYDVLCFLETPVLRFIICLITDNISSKNMPKKSLYVNWVSIPTSILTLWLKIKRSYPQSFCEFLIRMTSKHCLMWYFFWTQIEMHVQCFWQCLNSFIKVVPPFDPQINGMISRDLS